MIDTQWKPIKGFEKFYEVSSEGDIRSLVGRFINSPIMLMKQDTSNKGYKRVLLSVPVRKKVLVHRVVAEAFIDNFDNKCCVNHIDNNPSNNKLSNLEWVTTSENLKHAQNQGRLYEAQAKGGYVTSEANALQAYTNALALVGTVVNSWTVLEYAGKVTTGTTERESLLCKCTCGFTQHIEATRLLRKIVTKCRACSKLDSRKIEIDNCITKYTGTTIGNWLVTGKTSFKDINLSIRTLKFEAICTKCNFIDFIPQPSIIGTRPIKSCTKCKLKI